MSYRVTAPLVLAKDQSGLIHHVYQGAVIPWLSDEQEKHFLDSGLVEKVGAKEGPVLAELVTDEPVAEDGDKPLRTASKAAWVDYAVTKGVDREEAEAASKQDLIDLYG